MTDKVSTLGVFLDRMEATEPARQRLAAQLPQLAVQNLGRTSRVLPGGAQFTTVSLARWA